MELNLGKWKTFVPPEDQKTVKAALGEATVGFQNHPLVNMITNSEQVKG